MVNLGLDVLTLSVLVNQKFWAGVFCRRVFGHFVSFNLVCFGFG